MHITEKPISTATNLGTTKHCFVRQLMFNIYDHNFFAKMERFWIFFSVIYLSKYRQGRCIIKQTQNLRLYSQKLGTYDHHK